MRKMKFIFSILVSLILLIGISNKSNASTISTSETPSSVNSGSEFSIVIKFDEKVTGFNAHISYDPSLVTMSAESTNPNLSINPAYKDKKGDMALIYTVMSESAAEDTFEIKVKTADITEQKVAEFKISDIKVVVPTSVDGEELANTNVNVTIKPIQQISDGKEETSEGKEETSDGKEEPSSSNQYNGVLAKTGENQVVLAIVVGLIFIAIISKIKAKKIM